MAKQWRIKKDNVHGGLSGKLLEGCEIRENDDGSLEFLGVMAKVHGNGQPTREFPEFAYQGLIWNISVTPEGTEAPGLWSNNARKVGIYAEDEGTYTAQAGPGTPEDESTEDAASASA